MNVKNVEQILTELANCGVCEYVVCAGARNAPFVNALASASGLKQYNFFEERSAAFFALGRARASNAPVAVVTTSGTAVAELLPAAIEARYSGVPLVFISADRPKSFRGSGSPQVIEQVGLFGSYVEKVFDLENEQISLSSWSRKQSIHLNVCFSELALKDVYEHKSYQVLPPSTGRAEVSQNDLLKLEKFFSQVKKPLVIVGGLEKSARATVVKFLLCLNAPIYAEAISGIRQERRLELLTLKSGEAILQHGGFDGVLRIGAVPTSRCWRDLELKYRHLPVCSVNTLELSGLARESFYVCCDPAEVFRLRSVGAALTIKASYEEVLRSDQNKYELLRKLFRQEKSAEVSLVHRLSTLIPKGAKLYLGNSMPIREWDLAASFEDRGIEVIASRGANGIDGQLSTFFGACEANKENWAIVGDLTSLYDLVAPWSLSQIQAMPVKIVVINNRGGKIFSRLFENKSFQNCHEFNFAHWANMWNLHYECWQDIPQTLPSKSQMLIELQPEEAASQRFWSKYDLLMSS